MQEAVSVAPPIPIRDRIATLLAALGQKSGWLADKAGVERSTVTRILQNKRQPNAETLATLAPILGVTVEELVAGTDAADRVENARRLIDRRHYDDAVRQIIEAEQKITDLSRALHEVKDREEKEHNRRKDVEKILKTTHAELEAMKPKLEDALCAATRREQDVQKYRSALGRALTDMATLKTNAEQLGEQMKKLGTQVGDSTVITSIAAFCAAVAAAMAFKSYLKDEPPSSGEEQAHDKKARHKASA